MLYHYYSGKDALFLLCVQHIFQQLEEYLLERMEQLEQKDPVEAMQEYFLLRESFFQENPGSRNRSLKPALAARTHPADGTD